MGNVRGLCVVLNADERGERGATGSERTGRRDFNHTTCRSRLQSLVSSLSLAVEARPVCFSAIVFLGLDEGLGLAPVVHLDVDLGVGVALVSKALEVAAVAQQVQRQAESQHAQRQEAHVHLRTKQGSCVFDNVGKTTTLNFRGF